MLAAIFGMAYADDSSVTLYGRVDVGIETSTNVGTPNGNSTSVVSNADYASKLGVLAKENLGGGTTAGANLEMGFAPADGSQNVGGNNGQNSQLFNRAANVFIGNDGLGKVTIGRQVNQNVKAAEYGEVRGGSNFGTALTFWDDSSSFGGSATSKTGLANYTGGYFLSNAVRYDTPTFAGLQGSVTYVAGGATSDSALGNLDASNKYFVDLTYKLGDFNSAIGYSSFNGSNGTANGQTAFIMGNYTFDKFKVAGGFTNMKNPNGDGAANTNYNLYQISGLYAVTPRTDVTIGYYKLQDVVNSNNGATQLSLYANYKFSKRVYVWAGVASVNNNGTSGFGSTSAGTGNANLNSLSTNYAAIPMNAGMVQTTYATGISYSF